jgi:hypothetical protein
LDPLAGYIEYGNGLSNLIKDGILLANLTTVRFSRNALLYAVSQIKIKI